MNTAPPGSLGGNSVTMDIYHKWVTYYYSGGNTVIYDRKNVSLGGLSIGVWEKSP